MTAMSMDAYTFRYKNEKYTKEVIKDLKEVKEIGDVEEKYTKIRSFLRKHSQNFKELQVNKPKDHLGYFPYSNLDVYAKEIKKLSEVERECLQKFDKARENKKNDINKKSKNKNNSSKKQKNQNQTNIC